jgi:hypothetical protein
VFEVHGFGVEIQSFFNRELKLGGCQSHLLRCFSCDVLVSAKYVCF